MEYHHKMAVLGISLTGRCFEYKGNYYELVGTIRSKDKVTREWTFCILYKQILENGHSGLFSRDMEEFNLRFVPINREAALKLFK